MTDNSHNTKKGADGSLETKDDGSARARLLEAAAKLFAEQGFEGTSTRDIAKAADLNISLISYYFGGKEGLYKAVILEFAAEASARIQEFMHLKDLKSMDREAFKKVMHRFISGMLPMKYSKPEIQKILQREIIAGLPFAREVYEKTFRGIVDTVVNYYRAGQENGYVRKEINPFVVFLSMVHSTDTFMQVCQCQTSVAHEIPKLPEQLDLYIEQVYMIFVEGVLT